MNDLPTGKLRPVSLSDSVREELISLIVAGVLKPGQRLNEVHLAERLGVSRQTINALETGRYDPSLPLAFKIARVFEQPIESIFSDEEASQ